MLNIYILHQIRKLYTKCNNCADYEHSLAKFERRLGAIRQNLVYVTLSFESKVILVIRAFRCYSHNISSHCTDTNILSQKMEQEFVKLANPTHKQTDIRMN